MNPDRIDLNPAWPLIRPSDTRRRRLIALLPLAAILSCSPSTHSTKSRPSVIVISIDTLRSDHLPLWGYRGVKTPNIDALAADGVVFRNAWSHTPLTLPSHLTILTGELPPSHGVRDNAGYRFDGRAHPTIASRLHGEGYASGAAVSAWVLRGAVGLREGFDDYDDSIGLVDGAPAGELQRSGFTTEAVAERWITRHQAGPFFYFMHLYEPHAPYAPPAPFDRQYAGREYDGEIAAADAIVGRFIQSLKRAGVYHRAIIVLLSDHGEGLMDHGEREHGVFLYRESLQVPLIIKRSEEAGHGSRNDATVGLFDVAPTILALLGMSQPPLMHGQPLFGSVVTERPIYGESLYPRLHLGWSDLHSLVRDRFHLIDAPHAELYDLKADPAERQNLADRERRSVVEGRRQIVEVGGSFTPAERVSAEEAKKLAALGYVDAGNGGARGPLPDPKERIADLERLKNLAALSKGREDLRIREMESLLNANPWWSDVRDSLGSAYEATGNLPRAASVWEDGIRFTPRLAGEFAVSAGWAWLEEGDLEKAGRCARVASSAAAPGADLLEGELAMARGDLEAAEVLARKAEGVTAQRGHALFLQARLARARGDFQRVATLLASVAQACSATGESLPRRFHYVEGDALVHLGHNAEAERAFEAEISVDPMYVQAYGDLALLHMMRGDRQGAEQLFERVIAARPEPEVIQFAGSSLEKWGDPDAKIWEKRVGRASSGRSRVTQ